MPIQSTVWAGGLIASCLAQAQLLFTQLMTAFGGFPLLWGAFAIFLACRFLLAPLVGAAVSGAASDTVTRFRTPSRSSHNKEPNAKVNSRKTKFR